MPQALITAFLDNTTVPHYLIMTMGGQFHGGEWCEMVSKREKSTPPRCFPAQFFFEPSPLSERLKQAKN